MMVKRIVSIGVACLALVAAAMPTKKELKDVSRLVNELMSGDLQSYKDGKLTGLKLTLVKKRIAVGYDYVGEWKRTHGK